MYIEEYVPIITPINNAKENPNNISPPNNISDIKTKIVVNEVIRVLDNVWLID